ncbi:hypothetical protein SALBM311S_03633 [Streptomyces alboniger]
MRNTAKFTTAVLAAGALTLGLTACGSDTDSADTSGPLVVAASPTPHAEILNYVKEKLAKKAGLDRRPSPAPVCPGTTHRWSSHTDAPCDAR